MERHDLEKRVRAVIDGRARPDDLVSTSLSWLGGDEREIIALRLRGGTRAVVPLIDAAQELFARVTACHPTRYVGRHAMTRWLADVEREEPTTYHRFLVTAEEAVERAWQIIAAQVERYEARAAGAYAPPERTIQLGVGEAATLLGWTRAEVRRAIDRGALRRSGRGRVVIPVDEDPDSWRVTRGDAFVATGDALRRAKSAISGGRKKFL